MEVNIISKIASEIVWICFSVNFFFLILTKGFSCHAQPVNLTWSILVNAHVYKDPFTQVVVTLVAFIVLNHKKSV